MSLLSISSDFDYLKIFDDNQILISANGTPDADSTFPADIEAPFGLAGFQTITHSLGSVPLVRAFYDPEANGMWYSTRGRRASNFFVGNDPWLKYVVTTSGLKLIMNTDGAAKNNRPVFYRIYDLGNKAVDSDSRIDKIFRKDIASGSVPSSPSSMDFQETIVPISHNANQPILWSLQFAESVNGPWYKEGTTITGPPDTASGPPGGPYARYYQTTAWARANSSELQIYLQSNYNSAKTLFVRYELDYRS